MPRARNRWERAVQVLRWIVDEFNLPPDIRFEVVDQIDGDETLGCVTEVGGRLVIRVSAKMCRSVNESVDVVIHEAAHAKLWHQGLGHLHGPKFWTTYGRMMDGFDHHGHMDSRTYPTE